MQPKNPLDWMLSEALDSLTRAERLRQQFGRQEACWEPPIDVLETEHEVLILVALPGVDPDDVEAVIDDGVLVISGQRVLPPSFATPASTGSNCRRGVSSAALHCPLAATPSAASRWTAASPCASPNPEVDHGHRTDEYRTDQSPEHSDVKIPADALIIIPVRNMVLFPGVIAPITIARPKSIAAAQQALREQRPIGIVLQRSPETEEPGPDDLYRVATIANIVRYITAPDGTHHIVCQGVQRARILDFLPGTPFPAARVLQIPEPTTSSPEIEARFLNLQRQAIEAIELLPQAPQELVAMFQGTTSPGALADLATSYMDIKPQDKQEILETIDLALRMEKVSRHLAERLEVLRLSNEIGQQTRASFDERQREAILREQMATIQRQLGEGDGKAAEVAELTAAIAKANMPPEAEARRGRKCAATSACRRPPAKPAWSAAISTG